MTFLHTVIDALFSAPDAYAVTLEQSGVWQSAGQPNAPIAMMWAQICNILPFCDVGADAPRLIACKIARLVFNSITGIAICVVIFAGIKMMIAQGDEGAVGEAKKMVAYAAAGIVLSMIAWAVVPFVSMVVSEGFGSIAWAIVPLTCNF